MTGVNEVVHLTLTGRDLDVRDNSCISWPSPYLEIFKHREGSSTVNEWQKVYTSEVRFLNNLIDVHYSITNTYYVIH